MVTELTVKQTDRLNLPNSLYILNSCTTCEFKCQTEHRWLEQSLPLATRCQERAFLGWGCNQRSGTYLQLKNKPSHSEKTSFIKKKSCRQQKNISIFHHSCSKSTTGQRKNKTNATFHSVKVSKIIQIKHSATWLMRTPLKFQLANKKALLVFWDFYVVFKNCQKYYQGPHMKEGQLLPVEPKTFFL